MTYGVTVRIHTPGQKQCLEQAIGLIRVHTFGMSSLTMTQVCHRQTATYIGHRTACTAL